MFTAMRRGLWFFGNAHEHFKVGTVNRGLTNLGPQVEHDWALTGGLAMGAHTSFTLSARNSLGPARTLHCDHCREEFSILVHRYWHMHFCSSECVTAYQRRLAPETKVKIAALEAPLEGCQEFSKQPSRHSITKALELPLVFA
jgi:hypothetical protein